MTRPECPPAENIVRAITTAYWDAAEGRIQSHLFVGRNTSVSRLAVLELAELLAIFRRDLEHPPRMLVGAGEINVGTLQFVGREYREPVHLTVEQDPLEDNPAHAEIPQNVTRGLSKQIIARLTLHAAP